MGENKNTPKVPEWIAEMASDLNLRKGKAKRKPGRPRIYTDEEYGIRHRESVAKNKKKGKTVLLVNKTKALFETCQKIESEKVGFDLTSPQIIQILLTNYFKKEE